MSRVRKSKYIFRKNGWTIEMHPELIEIDKQKSFINEWLKPNIDIAFILKKSVSFVAIDEQNKKIFLPTVYCFRNTTLTKEQRGEYSHIDNILEPNETSRVQEYKNKYQNIKFK